MTEQSNSAGFIRKTTDRVSFVTEIMNKYRTLIDGAKRVFVKPNIVSHELYPTTTHPEVLETVLDALEGKDVAVGDGSAGNILFTHRTFMAHPLIHVCEKRGVKVIDLHSTPSKNYKSPRGYSVGLSSAPFDFDLVISLPVLKRHLVCTMTGALKNQFGLTTKMERARLHFGKRNIHKAVAEINAILRPGLFILDAVKVLIKSNEVRLLGFPKSLGYMLAGTDPVALDARGLELLATVNKGLRRKAPQDVSHIAFAAEYGVGVIDGPIEEI